MMSTALAEPAAQDCWEELVLAAVMAERKLHSPVTPPSVVVVTLMVAADATALASSTTHAKMHLSSHFQPACRLTAMYS